MHSSKRSFVQVQSCVHLWIYEGDVSDVGILVDAADQFVRRCAELIEQASEALRLPF
jgi:hypothetical protein